MLVSIDSILVLNDILKLNYVVILMTDVNESHLLVSDF